MWYGAVRCGQVRCGQVWSGDDDVVVWWDGGRRVAWWWWGLDGFVVTAWHHAWHHAWRGTAAAESDGVASHNVAGHEAYTAAETRRDVAIVRHCVALRGIAISMASPSPSRSAASRSA